MVFDSALALPVVSRSSRSSRRRCLEGLCTASLMGLGLGARPAFARVVSPPPELSGRWRFSGLQSDAGESGLAHIELQPKGWSTSICAVRCDLERIEVGLWLGAKTPGQARLQTADALVTQPNMRVVINGGFFDREVQPLGLRVVGGETLHRLRRADWGVFSVRARRATIVHTRSYRARPDTRVALQVGPRLVVRGRALSLKAQSSRRSAVALDRSGRWVTFMVTPSSVAAQTLADELAAAGFENAMLLDGGPSTQMSVRAGDFELSVPGAYPVPDLLYMRARARPTAPGPGPGPKKISAKGK